MTPKPMFCTKYVYSNDWDKTIWFLIFQIINQFLFCFEFVGHECPPDQEYQECGSACPATCDNKGPRACTLQCVPQCVCRDNLLRRGDGACVNIDKCMF